jgi:FkbM family methyltransferase
MLRMCERPALAALDEPSWGIGQDTPVAHFTGGVSSQAPSFDQYLFLIFLPTHKFNNRMPINNPEGHEDEPTRTSAGTSEQEHRMIPIFLKRTASYARARAATLAVLRPTEFYNPLSAAFICDVRQEQDYAEILGGIHVIRREGELAIWHTGAGEIATMHTEIPEHLAFLLAEFERNVYSSGLVQVKPEAIVLDVGANIGLFTKDALRAGARQVIGMEPNPGAFAALRQNLRSEILENRVLVFEKGAWSKTDSLTFTIDPKRPGRSSLIECSDEEAAYHVTVEVEPIDNLVEVLRLPRIDFIKMDIEGAELQALSGAAETLRRYKPLLAVAVEHTADLLTNAKMVKDLVLSIDADYHCKAGPYRIRDDYKLIPEILYFWTNRAPR